MKRSIFSQIFRSTALLFMFIGVVYMGGCTPPRAAAPMPSGIPVVRNPSPYDIPVNRAIIEHKPEVAIALIKAGANPNSVDSFASSPLHYAAGSVDCMLEVVRTLIEHGARVNSVDRRGWTPLHEACDSGCCPELIEYLISRGADVTARERSGGTPLHMAAYSGFENEGNKIIRILIANGANVNAQDLDGNTPLDLVELAPEPRPQSRVALLKAYGAKSGKEEAVSVK